MAVLKHKGRGFDGILKILGVKNWCPVNGVSVEEGKAAAAKRKALWDQRVNKV